MGAWVASFAVHGRLEGGKVLRSPLADRHSHLTLVNIRPAVDARRSRKVVSPKRQKYQTL